jgi:hypothetical protein
MTWLSAHWQQTLLIIVAVLTGIREVLDVCGDTAPDGTLQAIVNFLSQFTGSTSSTPPKS